MTAASGTLSIFSAGTRRRLIATRGYRFSRVPLVAQSAPPPPKGQTSAGPVPEARASFFSLLTFNWVTHILALGYARPLVAADLYELQDSRAAGLIADRILASYDRRRAAADAYNARLAAGDVRPGWRAAWWALRGGRAERERKWREEGGKKSPSLTMAMNDSIFWWFWTSGFLKWVSDMAQVTSPLLVKVRVRPVCALGTKD
jgi:hypothetical protein